MSKAQFLSDHLRPGEVYAGLILGQNGEADYHLFATLGDHPELNWEDAIALAKKAKLFMPNCRELNLLRANAQQHFKPDEYWSSDQYASDDACAWYQTLANGYQGRANKSLALRVVLVRRVPIKG